MTKLATKFDFVVSVENDTLHIDLTRLKDNKTKRFTFKNNSNPITEPYEYFMNSLTDDLCESLVKG